MAKIINARFQQKCDIEANWIQKENFVPLNGEIIIYDAETDETILPKERENPVKYPRIKIGDGTTLLSDLPFVIDAIAYSEIDEICKEV